MKKKEKQAVKRVGAKTVAAILVMALVLGSAAGGTVAWLIAKSDKVVNTFTYGDINLGLTETDTHLDDDDDPNTNDYKMIPDESITKDPIVTVKKGSEACWLFVKLEKSENFDEFLEYEMAKDDNEELIWTELAGEEGVYFRQVTAEEVTENDKSFQIILDDKVNVKGDVTKEMLNALDEEGKEATYPTLTVSAYAIQYASFTPEITQGAQEPTKAQIMDAAATAWEKTVKSETAAEQGTGTGTEPAAP